MRWYNLFAGSLIVALFAGGAAAAVSRDGGPLGVSKTKDGSGAQPLVREAQAKPPAAPAASQPSRVETTTYDSWVVTCQESAGKKACGAVARIGTPGSREPIVIWEIGSNEQGRPATVIRVPTGLAVTKDKNTVGGGILIANGIELKFGNGQARRLSYVSCNPRRCVAEAGIDDAFVREAMANTTATITAYTLGGNAVPLEIPIKGIDKAISLTKK